MYHKLLFVNKKITKKITAYPTFPAGLVQKLDRAKETDIIIKRNDFAGRKKEEI